MSLSSLTKPLSSVHNLSSRRPNPSDLVSEDTHYQIEKAAGQTIRPTLYTATPAEDFCLFFRDLSPNTVILGKTDDGNWKVSLTCRDTWSTTETLAASPLSWLWGGKSDLPYHQQIQTTFLSSARSIAAPESLSYHDRLTTHRPHHQPTAPQTRLVLRPERHELKRRYNSIMAQAMKDHYPCRNLGWYFEQTYGIGKYFRKLAFCKLFLIPLWKDPVEDIGGSIHGLDVAIQSEGLESNAARSDTIQDAASAFGSLSCTTFPPVGVVRSFPPIDPDVDTPGPSSDFNARLDPLRTDLGLPLSANL